MTEDRVYVAAENPVVLSATEAVQGGELARLDGLLASHPWLTTASFGDATCHRTLLHAASDWPGHFPNGAAVVKRLVDAGADVNAHSLFDNHIETPLHWAASSNDVAVLDALLDAGADIEAPGAVLGGGSALSDACGFGNWAAASRLVDRGARTQLQDAAALGLMDRLRAAFETQPTPPAEEVTQALWSACHGGRLEAAMFLAGHGSDVNWVGWGERTALDAAEQAGATDVATWLSGRGAKHAAEVA